MGGKADLAHLQQSMGNGLNVLVERAQNGDPEERRLLLNESDVLLECRCCRSFFRSADNFFSHKRAFCRGAHVAAAMVNGGEPPAKKPKVGKKETKKKQEATKVAIGGKQEAETETRSLHSTPRAFKELPTVTVDGAKKVIGSTPSNLARKDALTANRTPIAVPQDNLSRKISLREAESAGGLQHRELTIAEITVLETEIVFKEGEITNLKNTHAENEAEWKSRMSKMEKEMKVKEGAIDNLKKKLEDRALCFERELDELSVKLVESRGEIDRYKAESESLKKVQTIRLECEAMNRTNDMMKNLKRESDAKTTRITDMKDDINLKSDEMEKLKSRISQFVDEVESKTTELKSKSEEIESLKNDCDKMETKIFEMGDQIKLNSNEMERLMNELKWAKIEVNELNAKLKESRGEIEKYKVSSQVIEPSRNYQLNEMKSVEVEKLKPNEIRAKFDEISKLSSKQEGISSQPIQFSGITWKVSVSYDEFVEAFAFNLKAENNEAVEWVCPVLVEFSLISQKSNSTIVTESFKAIYHDKNNIQGLMDVPYKDLFDAAEGFVLNDSILTVVSLRAFPSVETSKISLRAEFADISKLTKDNVHSGTTEDGGMTWKLSACKEGKDLAFCLDVDKKCSIRWWCLVVAEFRVLSQKTGNFVDVNKRTHIYDPQDQSRCIAYLPHKDLFDEEKGFVKDDSIVVDVVVRAFLID